MARSRELAHWGEDDFGWRWIASIIACPTNVCYIEGLIEESQSIAGVVQESQSFEGVINDQQEIEGKIGCGEKV